MIARDANGMMIIARTGRRDLCSLLQAKCEAALMGLRTTCAMGFKRVVIEGDSLEVINALNRGMKDCPIEIRLCIMDCKNCCENFDVIYFQHVGRNKNNVVHVLTKHGVSCLSSII